MDRARVALAAGLVALCWLVALAMPMPARAYGSVGQQSSTAYYFSTGTPQVNSGTATGYIYGGSAAACAGLKAATDAYNPNGAPHTCVVSGADNPGTQTAPTCTQSAAIYFRTGGQYFTRPICSYAVTTQSCPTNSTLSGQQCYCNSGFKSQAGSCVATDACSVIVAALNSLKEPLQSTGGVGNLTACTGGCGVSAGFGGTGSGGSWWLFPPYTSTEQACLSTTETGTNVTEAPIPCGAGKCPGTVNGQAVCVACGSTTAPPTTQSASAAASGAAPTIPGAPAGATSSTSQTSCSGGSCTTTTTFRDSGGNSLGSASDTKPQTTFCQDNPASPMCRDSTISGSCNTVTCAGDAVQCAIAQEQARRNCEFFNASGAAVDAAQLAASAGARPSDHPGSSQVATSMDFATMIDQTDRVGGGCPADFSFAWAGRSLSIPFSQVCGQLQLLGQVLVGMTMLAALFIVFRG